MKKLIIIGLCLLTFNACKNSVDSSALRSYVKDNLKGDKGILKLSVYNDFDWDKVYILGPYTNERVFDATLKTYTKDILATGVDTDTGICLVMLFKGDKLVTQSIIDRQTADFTSLIKFTTKTMVMPYLRKGANFAYKHAGQYKPYMLQEIR